MSDLPNCSGDQNGNISEAEGNGSHTEDSSDISEECEPVNGTSSVS